MSRRIPVLVLMLVGLIFPVVARAVVCPLTITNSSSGVAKSGVLVSISGTGGTVTAAAVTTNAPGCGPATATTPTPNQVDLAWGTQCVDNGEMVSFDVTVGVACAGIAVAGSTWRKLASVPSLSTLSLTLLGLLLLAFGAWVTNRLARARASVS